MNKKDIIAALIAQTKSEVEQLKAEEKENLDAIDHEDPDNMNPYESTMESQTATILLQEDEPLAHAQERLAKLEQVTGEPSESVEFGALVKLNTGTLLVATSFQTVELDGERVTGISTAAPIFEKMQGMKKGAEFHLTNHPQEYVILDIQ